MTFGDMLKETLTNKPANLKEPCFYKSDNCAKDQLEKLKALYQTAPAKLKTQIEKDIRSINYGIEGEEQIKFELLNSHLPMIVLHDLRLEYEDLSTQIDYLIITPKINFVIECKNLGGDIEVNSTGDFIQTWKFNGQKSQNAIYNPITQNQRHLDMIRKVRLATKNNFITRTVFENSFSSVYQSLVVMANSKTILNLKDAKKEIKDQIIRADQLNQTIISRNNASKEASSFEKICLI